MGAERRPMGAQSTWRRKELGLGEGSRVQHDLLRAWSPESQVPRDLCPGQSIFSVPPIWGTFSKVEEARLEWNATHRLICKKLALICHSTEFWGNTAKSHFLFFSLDLFIYVYGILSACTSAYRMKTWEFMGLQLQMLVSCNVGAENSTQDLCSSCQCSLSLSGLSRPLYLSLNVRL